MFVDWFTVIAQIVNFLVLVALMQHFFYKRLVNAIDTREKRIENQMAEADQKNQQTILNDAVNAQSSLAGVNLDEEAAKLMQYQQQYQAVAKVISIAATLFDQILQISATA